MKFIGHLDLMRYFQKAMRRADIPIKYSEGFSPHQIMSFAAPLGVGLTSNGEYFDIEVSDSQDSQTMIRRLNQVMVEGVEVLDYKRLDDSAKNAMSLVAAADYTITFREGYEPKDWDTFTKEILAFYDRKQIMIMKKTKKGEKEMDLKPMIYEFRAEDSRLWMKAATGSAANLKPELFIKAFFEEQHLELPEFAVCIQREEVYGDFGDESSHRFISLNDLGERIE